jgi:hypothetical protein
MKKIVIIINKEQDWYWPYFTEKGHL